MRTNYIGFKIDVIVKFVSVNQAELYVFLLTAVDLHLGEEKTATHCNHRSFIVRIVRPIECFHSRDHRPYWFTETKESICKKIEFNSQRFSLGHQHAPEKLISVKMADLDMRKLQTVCGARNGEPIRFKTATLKFSIA